MELSENIFTVSVFLIAARDISHLAVTTDKPGTKPGAKPGAMTPPGLTAAERRARDSLFAGV